MHKIIYKVDTVYKYSPYNNYHIHIEVTNQLVTFQLSLTNKSTDNLPVRNIVFSLNILNNQMYIHLESVGVIHGN